ncbi:hypothetical protein DFJ73DRAFT_760832 [Zopfochytrium polystomum]|nr:hypothetical protein DFJ73DRAFT_760832 [Zopfochytrium polystomum]
MTYGPIQTVVPGWTFNGCYSETITAGAAILKGNKKDNVNCISSCLDAGYPLAATGFPSVFGSVGDEQCPLILRVNYRKPRTVGVLPALAKVRRRTESAISHAIVMAAIFVAVRGTTVCIM